MHKNLAFINGTIGLGPKMLIRFGSCTTSLLRYSMWASTDNTNLLAHYTAADLLSLESAALLLKLSKDFLLWSNKFQSNSRSATIH